MSNFENEKDIKNMGDLEKLGPNAGVNVISSDFGTYIHDAAEAVQGQKDSGVIEALKKYRWGVIYSIVFSA